MYSIPNLQHDYNININRVADHFVTAIITHTSSLRVRRYTRIFRTGFIPIYTMIMGFYSPPFSVIAIGSNRSRFRVGTYIPMLYRSRYTRRRITIIYILCISYLYVCYTLHDMYRVGVHCILGIIYSGSQLALGQGPITKIGHGQFFFFWKSLPAQSKKVVLSPIFEKSTFFFYTADYGFLNGLPVFWNWNKPIRTFIEWVTGNLNGLNQY